MQRFRDKLIAFIFVLAASHLVAAIDVHVDVLFGSLSKPGGVLPIVVSLKVTGEFNGTISVERQGEEKYISRVSVGQGRFRFEVPYPVGSADGKLYFEIQDASGQPVDSKIIPYRITRQTQNLRRRLVPWIIRRAILPKDVAAVYRDDLGNNGRLLFAGDSNRIKPALSKHGLLITPTLSKQTFSDWRMYQGVHCVIVSDSGGVDMTKAQVDALALWVSAGGSLLVSPDAVPPGFEQCPFAKAFVRPVAATGASRLSRKGFGAIAWAGDHIREDLTPKNCGTLAERIATVIDVAKPIKWHPPVELQKELRRWVGLESVRRSVIMAYVIVFLLCATVLERSLLKRFRMLHWTWLSTTVICAVFCTLATSVSYAVRGKNSRHVSLCIHDIGPNGDGMSSFLDCFVPADTDLHILQHDGKAVVHRLNRSNDGTSTIRMDLRGIEVRNPVWTSVFVGSRRPFSSKPLFDPKLQIVEGLPVGGKYTGNGSELASQTRLLLLDQRLYVRNSDNAPWQLVGPVDTTLNLEWAAASLSTGDRKLLRQVVLATAAAQPSRPILLALTDDGPSLRMEEETIDSRQMHVVRQSMIWSRGVQ